MSRKPRMFLFTISMMIFLSPITAPGVLAGGWATVTLDWLPV